MSYRSYLASLAPTTLRRLRWAQYLAELGGSVDDLVVSVCKSAVKARLPAPGSAADALNAIGADRLIPRGVGESDSSYQARLLGAWDSWTFAGTPLGMLRALHYAGYDPALAVAKGYWYTLDGSLNLVTTQQAGQERFVLDASKGAFWSKFQLVFKTLPSSWAGTPPASSSDEANLIRGIVKLWSPAWATCARIVIVTSGHIWGDPTLRWGQASLNWGGTTVVWSFP